MLATYVTNYGPFEANRVKYWLLAAHLVQGYGWSVQQLNDWLTSSSTTNLNIDRISTKVQHAI